MISYKSCEPIGLLGRGRDEQVWDLAASLTALG